MREPARFDFAYIKDPHLRDQFRKIHLTVQELGAVVKRLSSVAPTSANSPTTTVVSGGSVGDGAGGPIRTASAGVVSSGNISTTNLIAQAADGLYRVDAYISVASGGTFTLTLGWNDGATQTASPISLLAVSTGGYAQTSFLLYQAPTAQPITFSVTVSGGPTYTIYINLTKL